VLAPLFHAWERRLASISTDRVVRPFEWGADWLPPNGHHAVLSEEDRVAAYVNEALADTDAYFTPARTDEYELHSGMGGEPASLTFPSALTTRHPENNTVHALYFPGRARGASQRPRRAVVVLPQWNADAGGHVGLARLLARVGISALRLTLPYHDRRMPPELTRADFIVSANVGRTLEVCRQAVLDARRAVWWLAARGYDRIGILGTSLGSCLSMLTAAHEPLVRAQALNHVSPFFADVVWRGLSTAHVRQGLEHAIDIERLRALWLPISPQFHVERMRRTRTLLVYARYDLTFPVDLSRRLVAELERRAIPHETAVLPCGHYSTGVAPFKYLDGYVLTKFLVRNL
jgi:dienelactone hydrolase